MTKGQKVININMLIIGKKFSLSSFSLNYNVIFSYIIVIKKASKNYSNN